jgi:hypothetical protein
MTDQGRPGFGDGLGRGHRGGWRDGVIMFGEVGVGFSNTKTSALKVSGRREWVGAI